MTMSGTGFIFFHGHSALQRQSTEGNSTHRNMAVSLAPLYYGLLVILSIFFYNTVEDGTLIEGGQKLYETITAKSELLKEEVYEYLGLEHDYYIKGVVYEFDEEPQESIIVETVSAAVENLKSFQIADHIKESSFYAQYLKVSELFKDEIYIYFDEHPRVSEALCQIWVNLNVYYQTACDIVSLRINAIYSVVQDLAITGYETAKGGLFTYLKSVKTRFLYLINKEPVKTWISKYVEFHNENIQPAYDYVEDYVSSKFDESETDKETVYTFLLVILATFVLSLFLGKFVRFFAKETYNIKEATEYLQKNQKYAENHDNPVYNEFKVKPWEDGEGDDEDEEDEGEASLTSNASSASNRRQGNEASNRRTSQQEDDQEEQEEEQEEINEEAIVDEEEMIEESSFEIEEEDIEITLDVGKERKSSMVHSITSRRLMYLATGSVVMDDSENANRSFDLSSSAISEVTLAVDENVQKVPTSKTTPNGEESEARSSVRSLLV